MTNHISEEELERYRARELRGDALLSVNRHLGNCESCRAQYGKLVGQDSSAALDSMLNPDWLSDNSSGFPQKSAVPRPFNRLSLTIGIALVVVVGLTIALILRMSRSENQNTQSASSSAGASANFPSQAPSPEKTSGAVESTPGLNQGSANAPTIELKKPAELARVVRSEIVTLKGPSGDKTFSLLRPVGTFVLTTQPNLIWSPVKDAVKYEVSMRPLKGTRSIFTETTTDTSFTPKAGMLDKYRGQVLQWSVTAELPNGNEVTAPGTAAPEGLFIITGEAMASKVEALARSQNNELIKAIIFANAGLLDDAERQIDLYLTNHPRNRDADAMLLTIKSWRGKK